MATYLLRKSLLDFASLPYLVHSVSLGKIGQKYLLGCHLFIQKRSEFSLECSSLSVCPSQVENLVTLGPESHRASFTGLGTVLSKDLSLCRGMIVPCLLTERDFLKPRLSQGTCKKWITILHRLWYSVVVQTRKEGLVLVKLCWK